MKSINLVVSIGNKSLTNKAVTDFSMERNFSDNVNKFSMTIQDDPKVNLVDLELYMNAGYRNIQVAYTDTSEFAETSKFDGTIWDYTSTFVGDKKALQITGYLSRAVKRDYSGNALYNIDWNSYYNLRADSKLMWNAFQQQAIASILLDTWQGQSTEETDMTQNSYVLDESFVAVYNSNSVMVDVQGPVGKIQIPVPDVFTMMTKTTTDEETGEEIPGDDKDPKNVFWGPLVNIGTADRIASMTLIDGTKINIKNYIVTGEAKEIWVTQEKNQDSYVDIRGFSLDGQTTWIQLPPTNPYYGGGQLIYNTTGVNIKYIVEQLAKLEGWEIGYIAPTELVPCSDKFKMQNVSAMNFISEVLVPMSVTPAGVYTTVDGEKTTVTTGATGFVPYFKDGKFYYEPLNSDTTRDQTDIVFGYNIPNSPVISFQVNTKGTAFYTNALMTNTLSMVTGKQYSDMTVATEELINEYNKVKGHNESLDSYFGYTYEQTEEMFKEQLENYASSKNVFLKDAISQRAQSTISQITPADVQNVISNLPNWILSGLNTANINNILSSLGDLSSYLFTIADTSNEVSYSSDVIQKGLVNNYTSSGTYSETEIRNATKNAYNKIRDFMITAEMTIWGNIHISPNTIINITNMVKSSDPYKPTLHPSSGQFLVLKQEDEISKDTFIQKLSLIRYNDDLQDQMNPKIDYSKPATALKAEGSKHGAIKDTSRNDGPLELPTNPEFVLPSDKFQSTKPDDYLNSRYPGLSGSSPSGNGRS